MATDTEYKIQWLNGYGFWRGQYTQRNNKFRKMHLDLNSKHKEFIFLAKNILDDDTYSFIYSFFIKTFPLFNEKFSYINDKFPDVLNEKWKELCVVERNFILNFPFFYEIREADKIIDSIISNKFPYFNDEDEGQSFCIEKNGKNHPHSKIYYSDISIPVRMIDFDGRFLKVSIDCFADIVSILGHACYLVEDARINDNNYTELVEIDLKYSAYKRKKNVAYSVGTGSDCSRAIGLWLCDYIEKNGCTQSQAVSMIKGMEFMDRLGKKMSDETTLKRMHRRTKACVDAAEVLKIQ